MPLYRNLNKESSALPATEPTRRIVRAKPAVKSHFQPAQAAAPLKSIAAEKSALSAELGPVVGWLAITAGPGVGRFCRSTTASMISVVATNHESG